MGSWQPIDYDPTAQEDNSWEALLEPLAGPEKPRGVTTIAKTPPQSFTTPAPAEAGPNTTIVSKQGASFGGISTRVEPETPAPGILGTSWGMLTPEQGRQEVTDWRQEHDRLTRELAAWDKQHAGKTEDQIPNLELYRRAGLRERLSAFPSEQELSAMESGAAPVPTKTAARAAVEMVPRGFAEATLSVPEFVGIAKGYLGPGKVDDDALYRWAKGAKDYVAELFPGDSARQNHFGQQLAFGLGQIGTFYGAGFAAQLARLGPKATALMLAAMGSSMGGAGGFEEATQNLQKERARAAAAGDKATVDETDRLLQTLGYAAIGTTEALPIISTLGRVVKTPTGALGRRALGALESATEEALQESGSQLGQNVIAQRTTEPGRETTAGVAQAGVIGGLLGGFAGGLHPGREAPAARMRGALEGEILPPERGPAGEPLGPREPPTLDLRANRPAEPGATMLPGPVAPETAVQESPAVALERMGLLPVPERGMEGAPALERSPEFDELGLTSKALEATKSLPQQKGTRGQFFAMLEKAGVRAAEIEVTGLDEFLLGGRLNDFDYPGKDANRTLISQLEERIHVQEAEGQIVDSALRSQLDKLRSKDRAELLKAAKASDVAREPVTRAELEGYVRENRLAVSRTYFGAPQQAYGQPGVQLESRTGEPQYQQRGYTLAPENKTYRESLLHLDPTKSAQYRELQRQAQSLQQVPLGTVLPDGRTVQDTLDSIHHQQDRLKQGYGAPGTHFEEVPDILSHRRTFMAPVALPGGGQVNDLVIDEIQSDWGQALREEGAVDQDAVRRIQKSLDEEIAKSFELDKEASKLALTVPESEYAIRTPIPGYSFAPDFITRSLKQRVEAPRGGEHVQYRLNWEHRTIVQNALKIIREDTNRSVNERDRSRQLFESLELNRAEIARLEAELTQKTQAAPAHPLVNTTDQWIRTQVNDLISEAVRREAEGISLTPGVVQSRRWRQSQPFNKLTVTSFGPGKDFYVHIDNDASSIRLEFDKSGKLLSSSAPNIVGKDKSFEGLFGQDVAERIRPALEALPEYPAKELTVPINVEIGGEGMRYMYDIVYPRAIDKALKSLDPSIKREQVQYQPEGGGAPITLNRWPLTDTARKAMRERGLPMMALSATAQTAEQPARAPLPTAKRGKTVTLPASADYTRKELLDHVEKLIKNRNKVDVAPEIVAAAHAAIRKVASSLPAGVPAVALTRIEPWGKRARWRFTSPDGSEHSLYGTIEEVRPVTATYISEDGPPMILLLSIDASAQGRDRLVGELRHEATHALRRQGYLTGVAWDDISSHARSLDVMGIRYRDFRRVTNDPNWHKASEDKTLGELYREHYAKQSPEVIDAILEEEGVAHLVQLAEHGVLTPEELAPVQDVLEAIQTGALALGEAPAGGQPNRALAIYGYHGSPHDFERFSMERIGTGEGAQAFGHGLYFAENETVAKSYRTSVAPMAAKEADLLPAETGEAVEFLKAHKSAAFDDAIAERFPGFPQTVSRKPLWVFEDGTAILGEGGEQRAVSAPGNLYEVSIDVEPEQLLNWDKPISKQPKDVIEALNRVNDPMFAAWKQSGAWEHVSGETLYRHLAGGLTRGAAAEGKHVSASRTLKEAGIPGIRYLDQASRSRGEGTRNIVIFDDSLVTITKKNGKPVTRDEKQQVLDQMHAAQKSGETDQRPLAGELGGRATALEPSDYRGQHSAPDAESGAPIHDVTSNGIYPSDFYGSNGLQYYGTGSDLDNRAYQKILSFRGKPDERVVVWRAIPKVSGKKNKASIASGHTNPGDWVTIIRDYAVDHGESALNGEYNIVKNVVRAGDLYTSGDSFLEWGWSPKNQPTFDFDPTTTAGSRETTIGDTTLTYGVGKDGLVELILIETPKSKRGEGSARKALEAFLIAASKAGLRVGLNADPMDIGISKPGLEKFYKSLGFRRNAGKKRDFSTRLEYIREPD